MSEYEHFPKAFLPITQRILMSFAQTLNEERARAVEEGLPGDVVLEGTLNTLCGSRLTSQPASFFLGKIQTARGRARVSRVQRALSQALMTIMALERGGTGGPDSHTWPDQQAGHA